jgi:invasion protein IalB
MTDFSNHSHALDGQSSENGKTGSIVIRVIVAIVLLVIGGAVALVGEHLLGGGAPANEVRVVPFQDWQMVCQPNGQNNGTACVVRSNVLQQDTGATLLTLSMTDPTPGKPLNVTVPIGVLLPPGMGFSVGNAAVKVLPYETCSNAGCFALVNADADTLTALRGNAGGHVVVALPGNGSPVSIPYSLKGFGDAYAALQHEHDRQNSIFGFLSR